MQTIVFDIETGGLPKDEILPLMPEFTAPSNYKDAGKIQAWKAKKEEDWVLDAALSPLTGQVLAIGYQVGDGEVQIVSEDSECKTLAKFWQVFRKYPNHQWVGFNSNGFDVPYLIRRSWKHRVMVPSGILNGRYLSSRFLDLMQLWGCGTFEHVSLDTVAKFFGVGEKTGDGANFASLFSVSKEAAFAYLRNDVSLTHKVGEAMGVIEEEVF